MSVTRPSPIDDGRLAVPPPAAEAFAPWPAGWAVLGRAGEFSASPVARHRFGRRLAVYRAPDGRLVAMDARCWHLGADLAAGEVIDGCLTCPFHGWRFGPDGRCAHVPAGPAPIDAAQPTFATAERAGLAFVFPAATAAYPLPFFRGVDAADLVGARPFSFVLNCPWWLVGTNGFDLQHFLGAHDRQLIGTPTIDEPHPAARRIVATFAVTGRSWRDRLTRRFSGDRVTMDVTVWSGSLAFVLAGFRRQGDDAASPPRTTTFGMVEVRPLAPARDGSPRTLARMRISVRRRLGLLDAIDANVRRAFVRAFLLPDARLLDGVRYVPTHLVAADRAMADYLRWLAPVSHGHFDERPDR